MRKAWRGQIVRMKYGPLFRIRRVLPTQIIIPDEAHLTKQGEQMGRRKTW